MADTIGTAYVQIEPSFEGVTPQIEEHFGGEGKKAGSSFGTGFASVLGASAKVMVGAVAAGTTAATALVKSATDSFGEYEQLVGGVEKLFGNSADIVAKNASQAFATAGLSANEYMETVTGFSASLINSLGGDTEEAANLADVAMRSMSDNVNTFGTDMESVMNTYQGLAKENYTMVDNLRLGYAGTKEGMQQLIADAANMTDVQKELGLTVDATSMDFANCVKAIEVMQASMNIAGTTSREASTTIQGSITQMSAAWQNLVTGMGDSDANLSELINQLVSSVETVISNMLPVIEQALSGIVTLITELGPVIAEKLPTLIQSVLPTLLTSGIEIIQTLGQGIISAIPALMPSITQLFVELVNMLLQMLPQLLETAAQVVITLAQGIGEALPELIPTIVSVILTIVEYLIDNIDLLIDAAIQLMIGLATGLVNAIPILVEKVPLIISKLYSALLDAIPKLLNAGIQIVVKLREGLLQAVPQLLKSALQMILDMKASFLSAIPKFIEVGKNIVDGIKQGISDAWSALVSWFTSLLPTLVDSVKDFFKIGSPSKLMAEEVGKWLPSGIALGIEENMGVLNNAFKDMEINPSMQVNTNNLNTYVPQQTDTYSPVGEVVELLKQYLPLLAASNNVNVTLTGDMGRLFRAMQRESVRNTQIVGTNAVLAAPLV